MSARELRYAYPLNGGGSEYTLGEFIWTVVRTPGGGWQIAVEGWDDMSDAPGRVMASGFATAGEAEQALTANHPPLYQATGAPTPDAP